MAVEVGEELGLGVAGDREDRGALLSERVGALDEPRRRPAELRLRRVLDVGAPDVLVRVEDVDVAGAGAVGLLRCRTDERRMLQRSADRKRLTRLQVDADVDREAGVLGKPVFGRHRARA